MGFFFLQNQELGKQPSKQQRSISALNKIGCAACPLNKAKVHTPKMQPTLAAETSIYFLAEAPGAVEDEKGKPLIGPSGQLLRYCIPSDMIKHCSFDNIVRDRPPQNRDPTLTEIECCRTYVTKSIEQAKPKIIVGLGAHAQQWMLGSVDQAGMRGRVFAVKVGSHSCWFMPTYHPARVLHSASEQAKRQGKRRRSDDNEYLVTTYFGRTFKLDIEKALTYINLPPPDIEEESKLREKVSIFSLTTDFEELYNLLTKAKKASYKAIDIETDRLRPYGKLRGILSIGISFNNTSFSFSVDHRNSHWTKDQRDRILAIVADIVSDDTVKIAHNATFECEWFIHYFGKEIINHVSWECTQLMAHFLDERRGAGQSNDDTSRRATYQSLDYLIRMHFGISYKHLFTVSRANIADADLNETLLYNATDARLTLKLWHRQRELLRTEGLYNAYIAAVPRQCTVALMQHLGMPVNQTTVKRLQNKLEGEIAVIETEIDMLEIVQRYKKDHKIFNPLGDDAVVIFRDYLKCKEIHVKDRRGTRISIDKKVLEKIDHPLARLIVKLRNKGKMKSTYVDGLELGKGKYIYPDGHIHCNFNTTFTETGRTSSDEPNMQNYPHRTDPWVREQIEAPEGHVIVAADYGQLEACAAAMISRDRTFIKYLWEDFDTHMAWAIKIAKRINKDISDPKIAKAFRSEVKGGFVFASFYGASAHKVATSLGIEEHLAEEFQEELWETFSGYRSWQLKTLKEYREKGYVETPTKRRRHHPLTSNELLNAPIQGFATDIVVDAMDRLSYMASTENKWHLHPRLNVHDDLTTVVPEKKLVSSIKTIYKTMLTPKIIEIIPEEARVPLNVTVSVGKDWFNMKEIDKFWSHRDV